MLRTFFRRFFLLVFLLGSALCSLLTLWMGWAMHARLEDGVATGVLTASWIDWAAPLTVASLGPFCLVLGVRMVRRGWNATF